MGITTRIGGYETIYGGDPNRIHNVQLVARLIDGKLIAPGRDVLVQRHDRRAHRRARASSRPR